MNKGIILSVFFVSLTNTSSAFANEVLFLLQSAFDTNKVELMTTRSKQNILYINKDCKKCLDNSIKLLNNPKHNFIIVVGVKPIENLFEFLKENKVNKPLWPKFYLDPGLNLFNQLKINDNNSVLISHRNGSTKINVNVNLEKGVPSDAQLGFWDLGVGP